jgi:PAS domain S-box-containing protein
VANPADQPEFASDKGALTVPFLSAAALSLQDFFANFPEALFLLDADWRIIYSNLEAANLYRKTAAGLLGATPWEQWPTAERTEIRRRHERALKNRAPVGLRHFLPNTSEDVIELRVFSCEAGIVAYYRTITVAVTPSEIQSRLAAIVESSEDAIVSKDLDGIIQSWNQGAERIFGYKADEIVGKHISTIAPPETADEIPGILARIARGERVEHYETKRRTKDGRILTVSLTVSPVRDASGTIVGASKVARDVTERRIQEQALRTANATLARANADLQQFAYSASHDLQEPLRMVSTYSDLLKERFGGKLGSSGDEYIGYTIQGALRMEQLLKDLRAYMQAISMGQEPSAEIDAGGVLDKALANLESAIAESGATISRTALPRVRIHAFQLQQLFQNLIGNSLRYRSSEPPRIHVAAELRDGEWLFSVQDNGIGINPKYKEQVFGIFKRLHGAAEYPGTGMGLAICQLLVERGGGRIWLESEPGRGSTFFFTFPHREA